jgi:hypothetical protein
MSLLTSTDIILNGVGTTTLVYTDGSVLDIDYAQDLQIQTSATMGKQEGGSSPWPLLQFVTAKSGKITITNAKFSLNQAKFTQGGTLTSTSSEERVTETITPSSGTAQLTQTENVIVADVVAVDTVTGLPLTRVTTAPTTATQFEVTTAGVVTVLSTLTNPIKFDYYYTNSAGISLDVLNESVTGNCELRHSVISEEQSDGHCYKADVRVFNVKCNGNFSYDAKKSAAFSPKLEFEIQDSGRDDDRNISYSVVQYS